jgi:hypothetical protein
MFQADRLAHRPQPRIPRRVGGDGLARAAAGLRAPRIARAPELAFDRRDFRAGE